MSLYSPKGRVFFYSVINKMKDDLEKSKTTEEYKKKTRKLIQMKIEEYETEYLKYTDPNNNSPSAKKEGLLEEKIKEQEQGPSLKKIGSKEIRIFIDPRFAEGKEEILFWLEEMLKKTAKLNKPPYRIIRSKN